MAITYPGTPPGSAVDDFNVPTEPEGTPLSSAGTATRNHPELHDDLGNAVEELERWAALRVHDHSGDDENVAKGSKLLQDNTHESADTDAAPTALHHTIGPGPTQAAPGNHDHPQYTPHYRICTSTTRPASPYLGLLIFETDTGAVRMWAQFPPAPAPVWQILAVARVPTVRLRQSLKQQLAPTGTIIQWQEELEDNFDYFSAVNPTNIVMKEAGLYLIETAIQWDPQYVPDIAHAIVCLNGVETTIRNQQFMRGNLFTPGFSQTLQVAGKLRVNAGDVVTIKTSHVASGGLLFMIFSYFDAPSKINSRIDISFIQP